MHVESRPISIIYKLLLLGAVVYGLYASLFPGGLPLLRYFTIQSNILVALATAYFLFFPRFTRFRMIVRGAVLISILVTGVVFHLFLVPRMPEYFGSGVDLVNHLTHTVAPLGFLLDYLLFDRKGLIRLSDIPFWTIYPLLYWAVTIIQGVFTGFYPYFFMDVSKIGYGGALLWLLALVVFFLLVASLPIYLLDRLLGRKKR